jgi:hypothetical protein
MVEFNDNSRINGDLIPVEFDIIIIIGLEIADRVESRFIAIFVELALIYFVIIISNDC